MPKFTYSAAKGIEQSSGQGFIVQDVPISPSTNAVNTNDNSNNKVSSGTSQVCVVTVNAGSDKLLLEDGSSIGEEKTVIIVATSNNLVIRNSDDSSHPGSGALTVSMSGTSKSLRLIWNGTAWFALS